MNEQYRVLYNYLDDLLRLQSTAADLYEHTGVLGTVREDFIIHQLKSKVDNLLIHSGQVAANGINAGQTDVIIRRRDALNPELGGQVRIIASDCAAVLEIKSNATGTDFRDFNRKSETIKRENPNVKCGFVCYKFNGKKKNILRKFRIDYDKDILNFQINRNLINEYEHIDFVLCLDDSIEEFVKDGNVYTYNKFFFLAKSSDENGVSYILRPPFSFYFLSEIKKAFLA